MRTKGNIEVIRRNYAVLGLLFVSFIGSFHKLHDQFIVVEVSTRLISETLDALGLIDVNQKFEEVE